MTPEKVETYKAPVAQAYLAQIGAVYSAKYSTASEHLYHQASTGKWICATGIGDGCVKLTTYKGCPCAE